MSYTFTERKRIRKSFGTRDSVLEIPYLLQMQRDAYTAFLQKDAPPRKRKLEGLQAAFESAFPIVSHNGFVEMKFIEYNLAKPAFAKRSGGFCDRRRSEKQHGTGTGVKEACMKTIAEQDKNSVNVNSTHI